MSSFTYLITGASRGLGFAYTQALLASSPNIRVVATARNPDKAEQLQALAADQANEGRLLIVQLDVADEKSVETFAAELEKNPFVADGIDSLVNNAGIVVGGWSTLLQSSTAQLQETLQTNLYGAIWVTKALLPLLRKGKAKQLIFISSVSGSLAGPVSALPIVGTYAISKAALNMAAVKFARELEPTVTFHPGWVKTQINQPGDPEPPMEVEEAVRDALKNLFLKPLTKEDNAKFLVHDGTEMPW
ncbi:hypothetical protein JCM8097_000598 [Rhodosporidiobolus ruineniae]